MLRKIDCITIRVPDVDDVVATLTLFGAEACHVEVASFDITVGKCAAIKDPFGTRLCLLDLTKGLRPNNLAGSKNSRADV
jgi:predicted enzyme related to lactoylglutathione lyase